MKKICCMFLICMMVLTGFSVPVFADTEVRVDRLSSDDIGRLRKQTDEVFDKIVSEYGEKVPLGIILDSICYSDLIAKYYTGKDCKKEETLYLVKRDIMEGVLAIYICNAYKDGKKFIGLDLYFFKEANKLLREIINQEDEEIKKLHSIIVNILSDYGIFYALENEDKDIGKAVDKIMIKSRYNKALGEQLLSETKQKIQSNFPKNNQQLERMLWKLEKYLENNCSDIFNKSKLLVDQRKTADIVCEVLREQFNFGKSQTHIALNYFR